MSIREQVNILIVDDQPGKLLTLESILSELGENVVVANSADEALKHLLGLDVAVVLVDVCMPKMDGFELAEMIRQHPRFGRTAIIFISAVQFSDADRLRGYGLGAVDYIPVPIVPEVLRAKVSVFCELFRKTRELERANEELQIRAAEVASSNERLRFAERMATIGTLAAGLGHDMGNLLLPVRMRLDTLESCALPEGARQDVAAIREASEYLQRLAKSLRLLAQDSESELLAEASTDAANWWTETEAMLRSGIARTVTIRSKIPADLPPARIGKAGLTQVVFNLVQNSGDALKDRGDGSIEFTAELSSSSGMLRFTVSDDGPGMAEQTLQRCMEPFFTTKTRGLSTGLGLTLVNALVTKAQGSIRIDSQPGKGTRIALEIPIAHDAQTRGSCDGVACSIASVSLRNRRLKAHVRSILTSLKFDVRNGDPTDADVWITDADAGGGLESAKEFVASRPVRQAVVFAEASDREMGDVERIICLDSGLRPSALRVQLERVLSVSTNGRGEERAG